MNKEESDMWDRHDSRSEVRRIPAREEMVEVIVRMSPDEYERIRGSAAWDGMSVGNYLKNSALGKTRRGC